MAVRLCLKYQPLYSGDCFVVAALENVAVVVVVVDVAAVIVDVAAVVVDVVVVIADVALVDVILKMWTLDSPCLIFHLY
jgi:hypothetical protein